MLRDWCGFLAATLLSCASSARAADLASAWHAPSTCPSAHEADRRLRDRTQGSSLLATGGAQVWIDHAPSGELRARITLVSGTEREQRVLYGHDCEALSDAALLVISMASEADDGAAEAPPAYEALAPARDMPLDPPDTPRIGLDESTPALTKAQPPLSARLGPIVALDRGSMPGTTFAGGGAFALGTGRFQAQLSASYFSRDQVKVREHAGASAEFGLITGELRGCYLAAGDPLMDSAHARRGYALGPCVGLELGAQSGRGQGLARAATHTGWWAASSIGLGLFLGPYGRVAPTGSLALGIALRRPRFDVDVEGRELLFQAKPVFMRVTLGLLIELNP